MSATSLQARSAIVTGASRGIGAAVAQALDAAGACVVLMGRDGDALAGVASRLSHDPVVITADFCRADEVVRASAEAIGLLGGVDILVNNAATARRLPTVETTAEIIDDLLAVNVRAPILLSAAVIPSMQARGRGSIINLTSVSGLVGTPKRTAYAASKGALDAATRSMASELGPFGIRVNAVAPGVVDTDMWAKNKQVPGVVESIEGLTPLRRWSTPSDVADVVVFLAGDGARFITGQTISVDGGMAHTMDLYSGPV